MPAEGLIEKDLKICRILTGSVALLRFLAQDNIEQNVIQFLVLLYIMDKSGLYQYVICIDSDVQQCLKYPIDTLSFMNFKCLSIFIFRYVFVS